MDDLLPRSARVLWYNRKLIAIAVVASLAVGLVHSLYRVFVAPKFRATATVTMLPSYSEILYTMQRSDFAGQNPALVLTQTQTEFLMSRPIARQLVEKLYVEPHLSSDSVVQISEHEPLAPVTKPATALLHLVNFGALPANTPPIEELTDRMQRSIKVGNVPGSFILSIDVTWHDPRVAQRAANLLADIYVEETRAFNQKSLQTTRDMIQGRIDEQSEQLRLIEAEMRDFKSKSQVYVSLDSETPLQILQMEGYLTERNRLELRSLELKAQINSSRRIRPFTDTIALSSEYAATREALGNVERLINAQQRELNRVPQLEYGLAEIQQRREEVRLRMEALHGSLVQTAIAEASYMQTVRVIDPALLPTEPDGPGLLPRLAIWLVFGSLVSVGIVLFREPHGRRIRHPSDLGAIGGIQSAGLIPGPMRSHGGRWPGFLNGTGASVSVIQKHAVQVAGRVFVNGTSGVLLESLQGVGRHCEEILAFVRCAPRPCIVVNLDEGFHHRVERDRLAQRRAPEALAASVYQLENGLTYHDLHAKVAGAGLTTLLEEIQALRNGARSLIIVSPGVRVVPGTLELCKAADTIVFAVRANVDDDRGMRYYMEMCSSPATPIKAAVVGIDYPGDFVFIEA